MRPIYLTSPVAHEGTLPLPMIRFRLTAQRLEYGDCDTLMFTSKQAVSSAEAIDPEWKRLPVLAIGAATQRRVEELGATVLFRPEEYYARELAEEIVRRFATRRILYLRPRTVSFDSKAYLQSYGIVLREQIIYETGCRSYEMRHKPPKTSIIVFTSPSTIHCFLDRFGWDESYTAVVIGKATLAHLPEGVEYRVAAVPTIEACVATAKELQARDIF